jgi:hypothetical protein
MTTIIKYPRTQHIAGSKLQPGDSDLSQVSLKSLRGAELVIEEKLDGANAALSFSDNGELLLQSRGHYLSGGYRERHFALFKTWAVTHQKCFHERLGNRYVLYGEWLYAKHTVYYDLLPHWFMEFDIWDKQKSQHLSTPARQSLLEGLPIVSVPVVYTGEVKKEETLRDLIRPSLYKSPNWKDNLQAQAQSLQLDPTQVGLQTDPEDLSEGLYIKHEQEGRVVGRYKFIRSSFLQSVIASDSHWLDRPIVPNRLAPGVDVFQS